MASRISKREDALLPATTRVRCSETFLKAAVTCADTSANTAPSTDEKIAAVSCGNPQHRNGRLRRLPLEF